MVPEIASWPRRLFALLIDWVACWLVTLAIVGVEAYNDPSQRGVSLIPLGVFVLEAGIGTALAGGSFGQLVTRIRVLRTDGQPVSLLMALLRSLMIVLVVPPLVFKPDGRGLHDMATKSAAFRYPLRAADSEPAAS